MKSFQRRVFRKAWIQNKPISFFVHFTETWTNVDEYFVSRFVVQYLPPCIIERALHNIMHPREPSFVASPPFWLTLRNYEYAIFCEAVECCYLFHQQLTISTFYLKIQLYIPPEIHRFRHDFGCIHTHQAYDFIYHHGSLLGYWVDCLLEHNSWLTKYCTRSAKYQNGMIVVCDIDTSIHCLYFSCSWLFQYPR